MIQDIHFREIHTKYEINIADFRSRNIHFQDLPIDGFDREALYIGYSFRDGTKPLDHGRIPVSDLIVEGNNIIFKDADGNSLILRIPEGCIRGYFYIEDLNGNNSNFHLIISDNENFI